MRGLRALAALFVFTAAMWAQAVDSAAIDAIAREALRVSKAPGLAIAVVRGNQVVYLQGHGLRDSATRQPVTPDTLFAIGSLTKAFTTTGIAMLVDEGKMSWDQPVRTYLPWFRLSDPLADEMVTLRDLASHRTGLASNDLLWSGAPWSLDESVRRAGLVKLNRPFRTAYQYNNLMYNAAGLALEHTAGMPWREFMARRIFSPLGLTGAKFTSTEAQAAPDHATPHRDGKPIEWYSDEHQIRPAGSIKANARDLARWIRFQLNGGVLEGKRLLSEKALGETHTPQMVVPAGPNEPPEAYGLGWVIGDYHGKRMVSHGGAVAGFRAQIALLPEEKTGVVVLTNQDLAWVQSSTVMTILDHLTGAPKKDWHAQAAKQAKPPEPPPRKRFPGTKPSRELAAYAGRYEEPAYGVARVAAMDGGLTLRWSSFRLALKHFHFDTFDIAGDSRFDREQVGFALGAAGEVDSLEAFGVEFRRVRPAVELDYEAMAGRIVAALKLKPGERVLARYDPTEMPELVDPLVRRIRAADAVALDPFPQHLTLPAALLEKTDVFLWLPVGASSRPYSAGEREALAKWLDRGGTRREIHFHWADGSRKPDGLGGTHSSALDAQYQQALDIDSAALDAQQERVMALMRKGTVRIHTPAGTDVMFRTGIRAFNKQNGDASPARAEAAKMRIDREIELPAGVLRVAPIEETAHGMLMLPEARFGGAVARNVRIYLDNGKVSRLTAEQGLEAVEGALASNGGVLSRFREFALGFNPKLGAAGGDGTLPYFGYGAGVVRISLGDNEELGGKVRGGGVNRWFFLPDASVHVDGKYFVRNGMLVE